MKIFTLLLACVFIAAVSAASTHAQCSRIPDALYTAKTIRAQNDAQKQLDDINAGRLVIPRTEEEQKAAKLAKEVKAEYWALQDLAKPAQDFYAVTLSNDQQLDIKIAIAEEVDSGYSQTADVIVFKVFENVMINDETNKARCVAIPEGTKVYGTVDYVKASSPFRALGKATVRIFVDKIVLPNGVTIPVEFYVPTDARSNLRSDKSPVTPCKRHTRRMCIRGRGSRAEFDPALVSPLANVGVVLANDNEKNDLNAALIWVTLIKDFAGVTGISQLVNQKNHKLKTGHVFSVTMRPKTDPITFYVPAAKAAEEPKKDEEKK